MRYKSLALVPVVLAFAACAKDRAPSTTSNSDSDLQRDLALASSPKLELASGQKQFDRTSVVSGIERVADVAPKGNTAPKQRPKAKEPAPAPVQTAQIEQPQVVAVTPEPAPVETPAPVVATAGPRPTAPATTIVVDAPVASGGQSNGGGGGWGAIGSVIGVVIRGGSGGVDHCDPRTDGRRGGGIFVNDRLPRGGGVADRFPHFGRH